MRPRASVIAALLLTLLAASLGAIQPGLPSKTAIYVMVGRAIGSKNPNPAQRNPDYLAIQFLGPRERAVLPDYPMDALALDYDAAMKRIPNAVAIPAWTTRTKFFDGAMLDAVKAGATQVVILGAGFDSRAYRFGDQLTGVRFLEVDSPPTQDYKKQRVKEVLGTLPRNVSYVAMDFTKDDLLTQLRKGGYADRARTFFLWEGVAVYLPESAVTSTFAFVRDHSASGSRIAFDYQTTKNTDVNNPRSQWAMWGEPWLFGFPESGATDYVRKQGLDVISDALGRQHIAGYCVAVHR